MAAQTSGSKAGWVVGGVLGAIGLGVVAYEATKKQPAAGSTTTTTAQVTFSGIEGAVSPTAGGALPALVTSILNPDSVPHTYAVSAASGPIHWTPDAASFTLQPQGSRNVNWSATWTSSEGAGPFQTVLSVGVDALATQSFVDPTRFTISVGQPSVANFNNPTFSGGPSGTVDLAYGTQSQASEPITTAITNSGQSTGTFTASMTSVNESTGVTLTWYPYAYTMPGGSTTPISGGSSTTPVFQLAPGSTMDILWHTLYEPGGEANESVYNGTYTTTLNITPQ